MLGTIGTSLASAMADPKTREAALITFMAAAANIKLFGIDGAFWALVIGLVAYAMLHGQWPRSQSHATSPNRSATSVNGLRH